MKKYILCLVAIVLIWLMAFLLVAGSFLFVVSMINKAITYQPIVLQLEVEERVAPEISTDIEPLPEMTCVSEFDEVLEPVAYYDVPLDKDLQSYIFELCETSGMDAAIVISVIGRESRYRDYVVGDSGRSFGLMQIQARWHRERMDKLDCDDLLDPYQNVTVGVDYLAELASRGRGIEWVLMAYNGGPSYANKLAGRGVVSDYAREILAESESLRMQ